MRRITLILAALTAAVALGGCGSEEPGAHGTEVARPCAPATTRPVGTPGHPWFGVSLDWDHDSIVEYSARVGWSPEVAVTFAPFPLEATSRRHVEDAIAQVVAVGGTLLLTLEPNEGLDAVTTDAIDDLGSFLRDVNRDGVPVILRFAHEMNGSWYAWGQQPGAYVEAFRRLADAIHLEAPGTAMMWAPNYGGGYPFTGGSHEAVAGSRDAAALDTDGDGRLSGSDDPYGPYYPGDDAVDWVGMSLYHWGSAYPWGENDVPEPGKFTQLLTGTYAGLNGDETAVPDFYATYAEGHDRPLSITETAALYSPERPGDEVTVKQAWMSQVFAPDIATAFPLLEMVNWFEWDKHESEAGGRIDWTATRSPAVVTAFHAALPDWLSFARGACS